MNIIGQSQVHPDLQFNDKLWLVSLQTVGARACGGHARIIVEGFRKGTPFVGQYELACVFPAILNKSDKLQYRLGNTPGFIVKIDVLEKENYAHNYSKYPSKFWLSTAEHVEQMIEAIKEEQTKIEGEVKQASDTGDISKLLHRYQVAGSHRTPILGGNDGENCVTWAEKKLKIAHAGNGVKPIDKIKADPASHSRSTTSWVQIALGATFVAGLAFAALRSRSK